MAEARFTQSVIAQATLTPDGVSLDVNPPLCHLSGFSARDLLGRPVIDFMGGDDVGAPKTGLSLLETGTLPGSQHPRLLRHADGRLLETRVSVFPLRDETSADVLRLEAVVADVSGNGQFDVAVNLSAKQLTPSGGR